jgi:hypothetical protein
MYVTRVTPYMPIHIHVTKPAPCVLPHHSPPKISVGIVIHAEYLLSERFFKNKFTLSVKES